MLLINKKRDAFDLEIWIFSTQLHMLLSYIIKIKMMTIANFFKNANETKSFCLNSI